MIGQTISHYKILLQLLNNWRWGRPAIESPAPSSLRRAQIYAQLGRQEEAAEHYSRFIELWKDCDEELRPLVIEAEAKLRNPSKAVAGN